MGPQWCCVNARGHLDRSSAPSPGVPPPGAPVPQRGLRAPSWLRDLAGAWIFYSVLPAWPWVAPRFERIARFAPLIGLVLGGLQALLWLVTAAWLPGAARLALVMALALALSGGLHHDGALDTADGLAAGPQPATRLKAMADSRVGAAAVLAALQLALVRGAALACLLAPPPLLGGAALVSAAFWGRVSPLLAMQAYPYLRRDGSAAFHRAHWRGLGRELQPALLATAGLGGLALALGWPPGAGLWALLGLVPCLAVPWWLGRRLGGHSGDSYGACVEWVEALALLLMGLVVRWPAA